MMLGVFAYTRLRTIEGTATRLTTDYLPSIYLIGELRDVILLRYTLLTDHLTTDDEVEKSVLDHEIDAAHGEVDDVMNKYEKLIDEPEIASYSTPSSPHETTTPSAFNRF